MTGSPWKWLTLEQAADRIGVSKWTVRRRIDDWEKGDPAGLPATKTGGEGNGARWYVDPEVLETWLKRVAA